VAARQQKVRLHILIALTLVVMLFGLRHVRRTFQAEKVRTASVRTERELRQYVRPDQAGLQDMALAAHGALARDAAALLMQARYLVGQDLQGASAASARAIARELDDIHANVALLRAGKRPVFPRGKPFLRAYHSRLDDTFQPYGVCVPEGYDESYPLPVIITLHGLQGFGGRQCADAPCYPGALSVKPQGRGATDYMYVGEDDILAVLDEVRALYSIDSDRVYLVGHSMGATGSWHLAVHYPHLFAGIVPISGNADSDAWEHRWGWNPPGPADHGALRRFLHASLSPASYAVNLAHCRVVAVHGTGDAVVPVEHARSMAGRLREAGGPFEYLEFPQLEHGGAPAWVKDYAIAKVFGQAPPETPTRFRYRTSSLRHDRAWWVTVDALDHPARFAEVEADLSDGVARVDVTNVSAFTVRTDQAPAEIRSIRVGPRTFALESGERTVSLEKYGLAWRRAEAAGPRKRRGLSGPVSDALRDPFLIVYGTVGGDATHGLLSRSEAFRFADEWEMRYGDAPRIKADVDVTDEDMRDLNLLLLGGPQVNNVARTILPRTPLAVRGDAVYVGERAFRGRDVGFIACYPNPLSADRMVAFVAGTTPAALYQAWDRFGLWFNWGAYDKYKWFDYAVFDSLTVGPESFLAVGFFDNRWQIAPDGGVLGGGAEWQGVPEVRAALRPQGFPERTSIGDSQPHSLPLSELRPIEIRQYRGAVGLDRAYTGGPIVVAGQRHARGFGVRPPSELTFVLDGAFRRFEATVGLAEGFHTGDSPARTAVEEVIFEVWGDGELLAASPRLHRRAEGRDSALISADVTGVSTMTLKARPAGGRTWLYGAAGWAEPVLTR